MSRGKIDAKENEPTAAARLSELLRSENAIPYHVDFPDKEFSHIKLSIYGAPETNELFVKLTNGTATFVETVKSGLLYPAMADRIFGMDVLDSQLAFNLADAMWEKHKSVLVLSRTPPISEPQ
jgi:hypothetical protein